MEWRGFVLDAMQCMCLPCDTKCELPFVSLLDLQTIVGSLLPVSPTSIIAGLKGFGTSLASGVDVDNNSYNGRVM